MEPPPRSGSINQKKRHRPPPTLPAVPTHFPPAVTKVAVAQICLAVGYDGAAPSALRALSDVAARYILALARSAAGSASAWGRTEANVFDVVRAIEDLAITRGFTGASNPAHPLLSSYALKEIKAFVEATDEIPFARPLERADGVAAVPARSFAASGKEPPLSHIPKWLPCFPETWDGWGLGGSVEGRDGDVVTESERAPPPPREVEMGEGGRIPSGGVAAEAKRGAVSFRLVSGSRSTDSKKNKVLTECRLKFNNLGAEKRARTRNDEPKANGLVPYSS